MDDQELTPVKRKRPTTRSNVPVGRSLWSFHTGLRMFSAALVPGTWPQTCRRSSRARKSCFPPHSTGPCWSSPPRGTRWLLTQLLVKTHRNKSVISARENKLYFRERKWPNNYDCDKVCSRTKKKGLTLENLQLFIILKFDTNYQHRP